MMKAIQVKKQGGPEVMELVQLPDLEPGSGEAVVKLGSIGVNFIDIYQRSGAYEMPLPFTPGNEGAGEVVAVGSNVTEVKVGDRVVYTGATGSYAGYSVLPAWRLVMVPRGLDFQRAAAVMLQGMTAHYLVHGAYSLKGGQTCPRPCGSRRHGVATDPDGETYRRQGYRDSFDPTKGRDGQVGGL